MSIFLKKIIIENSFRTIISDYEDNDVYEIKPRYVNDSEYRREKQMWNKFQEDYFEKENEFIK